MPASAEAGMLSDFFASLRGAKKPETVIVSGGGSVNLQTMPLPSPARNVDPTAARGGGDITFVDDVALDPAEGPSGTPAEYEKPKDSTISVHTVQPDDTLSGIAKMYGVSPDTILWANDLSRSSVLKVGEKLTILPVSGFMYTIKKGDTLASIAKRFGADATEIANYNGVNDTTLVAGNRLTIIDGEPATATPAKTSVKTVTATVKYGSGAKIGDYMAPLARYVETQGIHGYNGVDLGAPSGTPIMASADGDVIVAKAGGYNGGYGSYVVIQHANGSQTLYAHMSKVSTYAGATVKQGQVIGGVGSTGRSTGAHLHLEIRNGPKNPF
ncbi:MAG: M23 family metallopeptidase [Patescibacteria group bacterium]